MLCEEVIESDVLTGYGPSAPPWPHCLSGCCSRGSKLQIRTRLAVGAAKLCAAYIDPAGDPDLYYTQLTTVGTYTEYDTSVIPAVPTGQTCTRTNTFHAGEEAIIEGADCEAEGDATEYTPSGCDADLASPDPDRSWSLESPGFVATYGGDSATLQDVVDAAIAAVTPGDWSDWTDLYTISPDIGNPLTSGLELLLSNASQGFPSGPGSTVTASQFESELRVLGAYAIAFVTTEGLASDALEDQTPTRTILAPGETLTFPAPTISADAPHVWLRCVTCPKFAATA